MKQMKALLIDPRSHVVSEVTYSGLADMQRYVGGPIEAAYQFRNGDVLYVDEEGLYRPAQRLFLFAHRPDQMLAGCGLVVGRETGVGVETEDPRTSLEALRALVTWIRL